LAYEQSRCRALQPPRLTLVRASSRLKSVA
jgi:hypothetical protein